MHPLSFYQKRTHLCSVARGLEMFQHVEDMTPARFDFFFVLFKHGGLLTDIQARLGLARQTVWKMVKRLVQLGLIVTTKRRRRLSVAFTDEGLSRMHQALAAAFNDVRPRVVPAAAPQTTDASEVYNANPKPRKRGRPPHPRIGRLMAAMLAASIDVQAVGVYTALAQFARLPPRHGREVGRIHSKFAWLRTPHKRKKRRRYLAEMERLISFNRMMAAALGNYTPSFYGIDDYQRHDPEMDLVEVKRWVHRGGRVETQYVLKPMLDD